MTSVVLFATSAAALISHVKNGLVERTAVLRAAIPGMVTAAVSAFAAANIDSNALRRLFGIFCVAVGVKMFFGK